MIPLDTNIVSEPYRARGDSAVRRWLDQQDRCDLFLCAPVLAELHYGIEIAPAGARRDHLANWVRQIEEEFAERTLPFDRSACRAFERVVAERKRVGRPIRPMDAMIAAIASTHSATLATRDVHGFEGLGLDVVNPFESA